MARFVVLVIDSFGVGAMADVPRVRPQDTGANTCGHILEQQPGLRLPTLEKLGLINALGYAPGVMLPSPSAIWGVAALQHEGGDTFMGHQEILGTLPRSPLRMPFNEVIDRVEKALQDAGWHTERQGEGLSWLLVEGAVAIGDNLEADLGQVYNITGNLNQVSFDTVRAIGLVVRKQVEVGRVIAFGGRLASTQSIFAAVEEKEGRYIGINAPRSGVYQQDFQVVHMGYGVDDSVQVPARLHAVGIPTVLIGKVADIVSNPHGTSWQNLVDSQKIMTITLEELGRHQNLFICTNIQETDLAGHAEDVARYADRLQLVDQQLALLLAEMQPEDCLVVMADHGNDPTIGHSKHTREKVPLLVWQPGLLPGEIGLRPTLSDVGATVCDFFGAAAPQNGRSFLPLLNRKENR
ncbi:phosphopentomutase [Enterobacter sp. BIGb0383]|uniref:phosphopentomutase n=1 Tax=unclassified Enterobacter TaxID=2608935 RepID=UPI000F4641D4|nr:MULTISPECIES: phosphopentomutase [unclassified Enterobacter]ROP59008.1 phosphopentomutase [Enterobacter sp. BIGb0383]ROS09526.1 phosphopentomutase [Enterobacter sp. BIGb0359]